MDDGLSRRGFITFLGAAAAAWPLAARPQQRPAKTPMIGVLWHAANAEEEAPYFNALLEGFRDLGYVEGRNIVFEHRFPNEIPERFASMAADLVSLNVDVLIGVGANASPHAKRATAKIPVVFMYVPDPVASKLVDTLARPGGNATGLTNLSVGLSGKRLQFLKDAIPKLARVGLLVNPDSQITRLYVEETRAGADILRLTIQVFEARSLDELARAFDEMARAGMQALAINADGLFYQGRATIARLALARRLPLGVWSRETLVAGALMSYGPDQIAISRRVAVFADKILKGARPAELPVEQPSRFEFLINRKTARQLGIRIPRALLVQATEVIE